MRLLITGGLGFVGINLLRYLTDTFSACTAVAADVLPFDDGAAHFLAPVRERITYLTLDVTDRRAVHQLLHDAAITHVIHAAAITPTAERECNCPVEVVDVNLGGTLNVLAAVRDAPSVERILLLSSSGVYGTADGSGRAQREEDALQLDNLYAITKYSSELLGARFAQLTGKAIASARLAAMYGPMERPTGSRNHMSHMQQLLTALQSGRPVRVAGPEVVRDWTYIDDVASAVAALLVAPAWHHPLYNISNGRGVAFHDVVAAFAGHGLAATWVADPAADIVMRPDQSRAPLAIDRLHADTGWAPGFDLHMGINAYIAANIS